MKKRRNDKGFTLVELIVVLVILAILAAILVPALLGYIDKAREKQITTNAEAAYVAAQALATEYYGKTPKASVTKANAIAYIDSTKIKSLTDIDESFTVTINSMKGSKGHDACIITKMTYVSKPNSKQAVWENGNWTVSNVTP